MPTNDVFYFFVDPENRIWLYDYTPYLTYIKNDTVHSFKAFRESTPFNKRQFFYSNGFVYTGRGNQHLVIGSNHSVSVVSIGKLLRKVYPDYRLGRYSTSDILTYKGDKAVFHGYNGVNVIDFRKHSGKFIKLSQAIDSFPFLFGQQGPVQFDHYVVGPQKGADDTLVCLDLDNGRYTKLSLREIFPGFKSLRVMDPHEKKLYICTDKGLLEIDDKLRITGKFSLPPNIQNLSVNTIYKDPSGSYWISTFNDGLYLLSRELYKYRQVNLNLENGDSKLINVYFSDSQYFFFDNEDRLYITDSAFRLKKTLKLASNLSFQNDPKSILLFRDEKDGHYIVSSKGIYYVDKQNMLFDIYNYRGDMDPGFLVHGVHSFKSAAYDKKRHSIIFLNHSIVYEVWFDGQFHVRQLLKRRFTNICADSKGRYWLSDDLGNLAIVDSNFHIQTTYNVGNPVTRMFTDAYGNIVFAIDGKGVFVYNIYLPKLRHLYNGNDVQVLHVDTTGLWFASNNFIKHYRFINDAYKLENLYLNLQGLLYQNAYSIYPKTSSFLLLCDRGVITTTVRGDRYQKKEWIEDVFFSSITFNNDRYILDKGISRFEHKFTSGNVLFEFSSNSTPYLGDVYYQYYMEGRDDAWQTSNEENFSYTSLPPGEYLLHLRAIVKNSSIRSTEKTLIINVLPLWWQTIWFQIVVVITLASLVSLLIYLRVKAIRTNEQREILTNKRMSELELGALQAQMNPHFIFNALTSVQSYIKIKDSTLAEELLKKFSLLIRLYLEFSRHKRITLTQELKALKLYTEIEQLRFRNKFDVEIKVRTSSSADSVLLPPMMIQPLVENAINHGLYHKPSKGSLKIVFWVTKDCVIVFIDDDGIGRAAAKKLRSKLFPSRGMSLVQERIDILKASGLPDSSIVIKDKYYKNNTPKGTRVILKMNISSYD